MRKSVIIVLLLGCSLLPLSATQDVADLYSLRIPYSYQSLFLSGDLGSSEFLQIEIDTSIPVTFRADVGVNGNYTYVNQREDDYLSLSSLGTYAQIGSSGIQLNAAAQGEYKTYTLPVGPFDGFYGFGGETSFNLNVPFPGTATFFVNLQPYGQAGIGRIYSISGVKEITNTLKTFGKEISEEKVKEIATYMESSKKLWNSYSSDNSTKYVEYWNQMARLYDMEGKELELLFATFSQQHAFEMARWNGMKYGWEAYVKASPQLRLLTSTTTSTTLIFALEIGGSWATLLSDETIYLSGEADITPTIDTSKTPVFYLTSEIDFIARYLFDSPRMWVDSLLTMTFDSSRTIKFDLDISGQFNYLIHPNFTAFGGARIKDTFDKLAIFAGGAMRLF